MTISSSAYGSLSYGGTFGPAVGDPVTVQPATFILTLSLLVSDTPLDIPNQTLPVTVHTPTVHIYNYPATLAQVITLNAPLLRIDSVFRPSSGYGPITLGVFAGFNFKTGRSLQPRIVRYIKDPIVNSGCPQCGTLLFNEGRQLRTKEVSYERNFDKGQYNDRSYVRCVRCGFICNTERDNSNPRESRAGWGINYTEVRAGS